MNYSTHISKGALHEIYCEDFLIDYQINENLWIFGVFDGCSSGKNSHFASALFGNAIISASKSLETNGNKNLILRDIVFNSFVKIRQVAKNLNLSTDELLSTMILCITDKKTASIVAFGDGLIAVNKEVYHIDQNNTPDYPAYHFDELKNYDDFEDYYNKFLMFEDVELKDITISTDGIFSFMKIHDNNPEGFDYINYLVTDDYLIKNKAMLARKQNIIRNKYEAKNFDDLAIIRITNNETI